MKKVILILAIVLTGGTLCYAQNARINIEVINGSRPPAPNEMRLMRAEESGHPNIAKAMHDMEDAMKHLHEAPDDFGGHKAQAEADLKQAWISLRKALYFRLYQDTH